LEGALFSVWLKGLGLGLDPVDCFNFDVAHFFAVSGFTPPAFASRSPVSSECQDFALVTEMVTDTAASNDYWANVAAYGRFDLGFFDLRHFAT